MKHYFIFLEMFKSTSRKNYTKFSEGGKQKKIAFQNIKQLQKIFLVEKKIFEILLKNLNKFKSKKKKKIRSK